MANVRQKILGENRASRWEEEINENSRLNFNLLYYIRRWFLFPKPSWNSRVRDS